MRGDFRILALPITLGETQGYLDLRRLTPGTRLLLARRGRRVARVGVLAG